MTATAESGRMQSAKRAVSSSTAERCRSRTAELVALENGWVAFCGAASFDYGTR